jgi:NOL1/NOP2/sun family putative RNA methylase
MGIEVSRYKEIFKEDFDKIQFQIKEFYWSIRANTLKISSKKLEEKLKEKNYEIEKIPFIEEGFWIKTEESLSKTIEHSLGYFFIQNASSMVPPLVLEPKPHDIILDLCAAPGAKTTQIAAMMNNTGAIIANDITHIRLKALRGNLQRCGVSNTIVTQMQGETFWKVGFKFNKILLDVPCTGTGTLNPRILQQTNLSRIRYLSELQKKLLISASKCLEENGIIVYSTCSLEPEENEENIDFAIRKLALSTEKIKIKNLPSAPPLMEWKNRKFDDCVNNAIRILPSEKTEGFFICKLRK